MFSSPLRQTFYPNHIFTDETATKPKPQLATFTLPIRSTLRSISHNPHPSALPSPPTSPLASSDAQCGPLPRPKPAPAVSRFTKLTVRQKVKDVQTQRRVALASRHKQDREDKVRAARGGDDEMQRRIYLAEQSQWEDMQTKLANDAALDTLDPDLITDAERYGEEEHNKQSAIENAIIGEPIPEDEDELYDFEALEPMYMSSNPQQQPVVQTPNYVQSTQIQTDTTMSDETLGWDFDDFEFQEAIGNDTFGS